MKKNHYVILSVTLMIAFSGMIISCNDDDETSANVVLDKDLVSLVIGTSETLNATVTPNSTPVTWISGNPEVATVENGVVRAVGVGNTVINAKAGNCIAVCDIIVTVVPIPVVSIHLQKTELLMAAGDKETVSYDFTPVEATHRKVSWSSNNSAVATVHPTTGEITAVSIGEATITVTTLDGSKTDECKVFVVPVVALKNPDHNATVELNLCDIDDRITFAWDTFDEIPEYAVKFSNTANFEEAFFTTETTAGTMDVSSYDLNDAIMHRPLTPVPIFWTVEPTSESLKVISRVNTLNVIPDRRDYFQLQEASATGMQITPQERPYHYVMNTSGTATVQTSALTKALSGDSIVLCFRYKSSATISSPTVSLYKSGGVLEAETIAVKAIASSSVWTEWAVLLNFNEYDWGTEGDYLEFEFGSESAQLEINCIYFRGISHLEYVPQVFTVVSNNSHTIMERVSETEFVIESTGNDPNVNLNALTLSLPVGASILKFEYKSEQTMANYFQIYFGPGLAESRSTGSSLGTVPPASDWTERSYDLGSQLKTHIWGYKGDWMRFDFGNQPGYIIQIRNIRFEYP